MSKTCLLIILLLSSTLGFGQIPNYVPSNGLIGWWPFTGNAQDLSGNGHHGTVTGATLTTDRFGAASNAYNFDGNDWITLDNLPQINGLNAITISVWVKSSGFNQNQSCNMGCRQFYFSRGANGQNGFYIQTDQNIGANVSNFTGSINGSFNTPQGGWAGSNVSTPIPHSTWHHVVLVYNGSTIRLFLNGVQQSSNSYTTNVQSSNSLAYFGRMDPIEPVYTYFTVGKIDDAGIWDRALTNQEISQLYNASPGTVNALNCSSYVLNGALLSGQAASNVTLNLTYSGGNGGFYGGQSIFSTGVTGLTATIPSGTLANGNGSITYTISGTPSGIGSATFPISFGGQSCNVVIPITSLNNQYPPGSVFCANGPTAIVDVTNPTTGKTWMDRNLGASQVATSSTDPNAYGDLYQWGRFSDGHQCRTSPTTSALSSLDQPGNNMFILAPNTPYDWRSPQNTNLWQGVNGVNNPCPMGYRIPTETELDNERLSWGYE